MGLKVVFFFNFILPLLLEEMIQVVEKFSSNRLKLPSSDVIIAFV